MRVKKIFSKQIFEELVSLKRHNFLNTQDNLKYKNLKVYVFEYTEELIIDFNEINKRRKSEKENQKRKINYKTEYKY